MARPDQASAAAVADGSDHGAGRTKLAVRQVFGLRAEPDSARDVWDRPGLIQRYLQPASGAARRLAASIPFCRAICAGKGNRCADGSVCAVSQARDRPMAADVLRARTYATTSER